MEGLWFCLLAFLLIAYAVLDGFDLGAGMLHLIVARTDEERRTVLASIGPVWDGNEVWLLAAGGTLFCAFPRAYAAAFSGLYLALMVVLWVLAGRALGIELRNQVEGTPWRPFWDAIFSLCSALLALLLSVALGNVIRGVPLNSEGYFFEPLWTDFSPLNGTGILDPFTLLVGLTGTATLMLHGATWLVLRTEGQVAARASRLIGPLWWTVSGLALLATTLMPLVQPHISERIRSQPWGMLFPLLAIGALYAVRSAAESGAQRRAFVASSAFITTMLGGAAFGLYPYLLPATSQPANGLTIWNCAADPHGLSVAIVWWIPGVLLVIGYMTLTYRMLGGKITPRDLEQGH